MRKNHIQQLSSSAYTLFADAPTLSEEGKSFQFAAFVAHEASSRAFPLGSSDAATCLASQELLKHTTNGHRYSSNIARHNLTLKKALDEQKNARMPWVRQPAEVADDTDLSEALQEVIQSESSLDEALETLFKRTYPAHEDGSIHAMKDLYFRAFSVAYLAFSRASRDARQTPNQDGRQARFESSVQTDLERELAEPWSCASYTLEILASDGMQAFLIALTVIGLCMLALPSLGFILIPVAATYTLASATALTGASLFLVGYCHEEPEDEVYDAYAETLLTATP
jgi:hypothetical protein